MKLTPSKPAISKPGSTKAKLNRGNPQVAKPPAKARPAPKATAAPVTEVPAQPETKQSQLIALLRSSSGATLAQMMTLTGWQSHTVRGMLSGSLRKRLGLTVQWQLEDAVRVYRIVEGS